MDEVVRWGQSSVAGVSCEALRHNARVIRGRIGGKVKLCAMVKADGYGHRAAVVAEALCGADREPLVDVLAVANVAEAAAVGRFGVPVLVVRPIEGVGSSEREEVEAAVRNGWTLTVCSRGAAIEVARAAERVGRAARVEVMVDTGMGRGGVEYDLARAAIACVMGDDRLVLGGVYTHFANAEEREDPVNEWQLGRLLALRDEELAGVPFHAANTAAVFNRPGAHLDMVRVGIGLYGGAIFPGLRPVMRWATRIVGINRIGVGDAVGYGGTWRAGRESLVGLLPVGYADGYARAMSNRGVVMVGGRAAPVIGRVSMDLTTVDLTDIPEARVGDEAVLVDDDPASPASVARVAEVCGTIPYEVFCRIGQRTERVLVGESQVGELLNRNAA